MKQLLALPLLFIAICCHGQIGSTSAGWPKIRKTQGSNEYQNVHCGLEDRNGNLWFGTTGEGVYRYDGKLFTQFTVKDGLSSNVVYSILEDARGNIWAGTEGGACRYDGKKFNYVPFTTMNDFGIFSGSADDGPKARNTVWSMLQDKKGIIWFGSDSGLYCYDGKTFSKFTDDVNVVNKAGVTLKSIQCMMQDSKGNMWFGSGPMAFEGICRYDGKTVENFKPGNETWVRQIAEEGNGDILFATRHNGVCRYDGKTFSYIFASKGMIKGLMMSCLTDRAGNQWFASDYGTKLNDSVGGVWRYDGRHYTKYSTKDGLTNNAVFLVMEDRKGNIWAGTRNTGLYRFNGNGFTSFSE